MKPPNLQLASRSVRPNSGVSAVGAQEPGPPRAPGSPVPRPDRSSVPASALSRLPALQARPLPSTPAQPPPRPTLPAEAPLLAAALGEEAVEARVDAAGEDAGQGQSQADGLHRLHYQRRQRQQAEHSPSELHTRTRAALRVPEPTADP